MALTLRFAFDEDPLLGRERVGVWREFYDDDVLELKIWDAGFTWGGRHGYQYQLTLNGKVIFSGDDFTTPLQMYTDPDELAESILGALGIQEDDVDPESFEDYTPEQLEFTREWGEIVKMWGMNIEEGSVSGQSWRGGDPFDEEN